jgi:thiol-disulfide isomerase/thioredoxin
MSTKTLIGVLLAGTTGLIIFLFVHLSSDSTKIHLGAAHAQACDKAAGDCLPDVKYVDTQGKVYTPESLAGKVVVVNFWATWCHPCQKEIPDLSKVYAQYKDRGVVFLGILTDQDQPSDSQLLNFESDYEMSYPVVRVNSDILLSYNYPQALPTTFVFNRSGKQVYKQLGAISEDRLSALLDQYVAEK